MSAANSLEEKLGQLLSTFGDLRGERDRLAADNQAQAARIAKLEGLIATLEVQVDELGRDRYKLKKLQDERKVIRRKLDQALTRLAELEGALQS
jgi:chromosome segregation ATPase